MIEDEETVVRKSGGEMKQNEWLFTPFFQLFAVNLANETIRIKKYEKKKLSAESFHTFIERIIISFFSFHLLFGCFSPFLCRKNRFFFLSRYDAVVVDYSVCAFFYDQIICP